MEVRQLAAAFEGASKLAHSMAPFMRTLNTVYDFKREMRDLRDLLPEIPLEEMNSTRLSLTCLLTGDNRQRGTAPVLQDSCG